MPIKNHIDTICDVTGMVFKVDEARETRHGFSVYLGRQLGVRRGQQPGVILTQDLADYITSHCLTPNKIDLPLSEDTIKRLRKKMGLYRYQDRRFWTAERDAELLNLRATGLSLQEIASRFGKSTGLICVRLSKLKSPVKKYLYTVHDIYGVEFNVYKTRPTKHGFDILLGRKVGSCVRFASNIIFTHELVNYVATVGKKVTDLDLPLNKTSLIMLRARFGPEKELKTAVVPVELLGTMSDVCLAKDYGLSTTAIAKLRRKHGILPFSGPKPRVDWKRWDPVILASKMTYTGQARLIGCNRSTMTDRLRRLRGIVAKKNNKTMPTITHDENNIMIKTYNSHEKATTESFKKDPGYAAEYLNAVIADGDQKKLMLALRRVASAFGVKEVAENAQLNPNTLYRALSPTGNPKLRSFQAILGAMGMRLEITPLEPKKHQ